MQLSHFNFKNMLFMINLIFGMRAATLFFAEYVYLISLEVKF